MSRELWDDVVGIPLEDWRRATTATELAWLTHLRDHPLPLPPKPPAPVYEWVDVPDFGSEFAPSVRGRVRR